MDRYKRIDHGIEVRPTTDIITSPTSIEPARDLGVSMSLMTKKHWRPNYDLVWVKNKGAFIVLLWNFLTISVYHYTTSPDGAKYLLKRISPTISNYPTIPLALSTVFYPIAGWLADVHVGRYKTIRASLWIMWIGIVMYVVCRIIAAELNENSKAVHVAVVDYFYLFIYLVLVVGLAGYQANIIQFGVDQLLDASSREVTAFVIWYAGTTFGGGVLVYFLGYLPKYNILQPLLVALNLSLALCLDFCFSSKQIVKEPTVTQNPFQLVRKVIAYAIKNKHPRMRSAFTYWEDKLPSRIDLAKTRYGGPFTSEQVEDVKTFFRMLAIIALGTIIVSAIVVTNYIMDIMSRHTAFHKSNTPGTIKFTADNWYKIFSIDHLATYSSTFLVLVYELVIYPIFHRWIPKLAILNKVAIGLLLVLLDVIAVITLNQTGRYKAHSSANTSLECMLVTKDSTLNFSYYWFAIPKILYSLSLLISTIGSLEFICAQCPYSMKGLLIGTMFGMVGVMTLIEVLIIIIPFKLTADHYLWKGLNLFNCGFWMLTIEGLFVTAVIIIFCFMRKRYKRRQREDVNSTE